MLTVRSPWPGMVSRQVSDPSAMAGSPSGSMTSSWSRSRRPLVMTSLESAACTLAACRGLDRPLTSNRSAKSASAASSRVQRTVRAAVLRRVMSSRMPSPM